jgi:hypothetical protein
MTNDLIKRLAEAAVILAGYTPLVLAARKRLAMAKADRAKRDDVSPRRAA